MSRHARRSCRSQGAFQARSVPGNSVFQMPAAPFLPVCRSIGCRYSSSYRQGQHLRLFPRRPRLLHRTAAIIFSYKTAAPVITIVNRYINRAAEKRSLFVSRKRRFVFRENRLQEQHSVDHQQQPEKALAGHSGNKSAIPFMSPPPKNPHSTLRYIGSSSSITIVI